jgi:hypothetical protein
MIKIALLFFRLHFMRCARSAGKGGGKGEGVGGEKKTLFRSGFTSTGRAGRAARAGRVRETVSAPRGAGGRGWGWGREREGAGCAQPRPGWRAEGTHAPLSLSLSPPSSRLTAPLTSTHARAPTFRALPLLEERVQQQRRGRGASKRYVGMRGEERERERGKKKGDTFFLRGKVKGGGHGMHTRAHTHTHNTSGACAFW